MAFHNPDPRECWAHKHSGIPLPHKPEGEYGEGWKNVRGGFKYWYLLGLLECVWIMCIAAGEVIYTMTRSEKVVAI